MHRVRAVLFDRPGDESVLRVGEWEAPACGPRELRLEVRELGGQPGTFTLYVDDGNSSGNAGGTEAGTSSGGAVPPPPAPRPGPVTTIVVEG